MKKTIKKRAFVSAIAMLIVSAIVLTSSTFAWFSMSKQATVEQMNLTVSSPEGIQVSANAKGWTATLTQDNLFNTDSTISNASLDAYDGNYNFLPSSLVPVSSAFGNANATTGFANFYKIRLDDTGKVYSNIVDQSNTALDPGFVAFDLFLKVANNGTAVRFADESVFDDGNAANEGPVTALRLGFQIMGTVDSNATPEEAQALGRNTTYTRNGIVYEPDSMNRSFDAKQTGLSNGVINTNYVQSNIPDGVYVTDSKVIPARNEVSGETANIFRGITFIKSTSKNTAALTLNAGITKVRVYIWMEGQDVDCRNSVASSSLTVNLKFNID